MKRFDLFLKFTVSLFCVFPALVGSGSSLAQKSEDALEVDPDLPQAPKITIGKKSLDEIAKGNEYLIYSEVPTAYFGVYNDLNRIKWLSVPKDSTKPLDKEKCDEISDRYIASCLEKATNAKKNKSARWVDYAWALMYRSRWDDAIKAFEKAIEVSGDDGYYKARSFYGIADCHLGAGRFEKSRQTLHELLSSNITWPRSRKLVNWNARARQVLHWMDGENLLSLNMPRWTGYKAFPEPKKAYYSEDFVPAAKIVLKVEGFSAADARINFLKKKLTSRGVEFVPQGGHNLVVSLDENARVENAEGYTLSITKESSQIIARDMQGILWGLVSFMQIYDYENKRVRICVLDDWPDCPKRGFLGRCCVNDLEFMLFNKMNINTAKPNFLSQAQYTPFNLYLAKSMAKEYKDFGLELYYGFSAFTMNLAWPLCWNVFLEMQLEHAMIWASCGVGIYYPYDDARYWLPTYTPEDNATGLKPSDYDAKHLLKFYTRMKERYPDFKMQFCPPFYWGPRRGHPYPDDRTKYLESLRCLPEEVSIFWTGERVGSRHKAKSDCDWYTQRTGRPPSLFQNKAGLHYYLSYVVDEMPWDEWYYKGFVEKDMRSIQKNSDTPQDYPILTTLADYLWNVDGYDRKRAVKNGLEQYAGKGTYEVLTNAYKKLCRIDRFKYGRLNSRVLYEDAAEWEQASKEIHEATEKVSELAGPLVMKGFGSWTTALCWFDYILKNIKTHPDYHKIYKKPYELQRVHLLEDEVIKYNEAKDIFIDPLKFRDSYVVAHPSTSKKPIMPTSSVAAFIAYDEKATALLELAQVPQGGIELFVRGSSGPRPKGFKVEVNESVVFDGENVFGSETSGQWNTLKLNVPKDALKKGENKIILYNSQGYGYPIYVEFVVVRPKEK